MSSGFSFFTSKAATQEVESKTGPVAIVPTPAQDARGASREFDAPSMQNKGSEASLLGMPISMEQDIKLIKSSEARVVKKKKRAPRVGFARGDDGAEEDVDVPAGSVYESSLSDSVSQTDSELAVPSADEEHSSATANATATAAVSNQSTAAAAIAAAAAVAVASTATIVVAAASATAASGNSVPATSAPGSDLTKDTAENNGQSHSAGEGVHPAIERAASGGFSFLQQQQKEQSEQPVSVTTSTAAAADKGVSAVLVGLVLPSLSLDKSPSQLSAAASPVGKAPSSSMFSGMSLSSPSSSYGKERSYSIGESPSQTPSIAPSRAASITAATISATSTSTYIEMKRTVTSESEVLSPLEPSSAKALPSVPPSPSSLSSPHPLAVSTAAKSPYMLSSTVTASAYSSFSHLTIDDNAAYPMERSGRDTSGRISSTTPSSSSATAGVEEKGGEKGEGGGSKGMRVEESDPVRSATALSEEYRRLLEELMEEQEAAGREKIDQRRELRRLTQWLEGAKKRVGDMEEDQVRLAALEEFDQADSLTETLDLLLIEISTTTARCKYIEGESMGSGVTGVISGANSGPLSAIHAAQAKAISEVTSALCVFTVEEERRVKESMMTRTEELAGDERRLRREKERIDVEQTYIAEEEKTLAEQSAEMETLMEVQAGDTIGRKAQLEAQHRVLISEMQHLERQLEVKRAERSHLSAELETVNDRIKQVRKNFQRQITRVEDRKVQLDATRLSCSSDLETITASQKRHKDSIARVKRAQRESEGWCKRVEDEVAALTSIREVLYSSAAPSVPSGPSSVPSTAPSSGTERVTEGSLTHPTGTTDTHLQSLRDRLSAIETTLSATLKAQTDVTLLGGSLESEAKEVQDLQVKLEVEKKAHAVARRFKEAAVVAKEEKNVLQRREELMDQIAGNKREKEERIEEVAQLEATRGVLSKELSAVRREADARCYATLRGKENELLLLQQILTLKQKHPDTHPEGGPIKDASSPSLSSSSDTSLSNMAMRLVAAKIQELRFEIQDLEEIYPDLRASVSALTQDPTQDPPHSPGGESEANSPVNEGKEGKEGEMGDSLLSGQDSDGDSRGSTEATDASRDASPVEGEREHSDSGSGSEVPAEDDGAEDALPPGGLSEGDRDLLLGQVKCIISELTCLEEQLLAATDTEDYELADTLDGSITEKRAQVADTLLLLEMTEEDLQ